MKRVFVVILLMSIVLGMGNLVEASEDYTWIEFETKQNVDLMKEWTIEFSSIVTEDSVKYLAIEKDNIAIPTYLEIIGNDNYAKISPRRPYDSNEEYTLKIHLKNGNMYIMKFITQDITGQMVPVKSDHFSYEITNNTNEEIDVTLDNIISYEQILDSEYHSYGHKLFSNRGGDFNYIPDTFSLGPNGRLRVSLSSELTKKLDERLIIEELNEEVVDAYLFTKGTTIRVANNIGNGENRSVVINGEFYFIKTNPDTTELYAGDRVYMDYETYLVETLKDQNHLLLESTSDSTAYVYGPSKHLEYYMSSEPAMEFHILEENKSIRFKNNIMSSVMLDLLGRVDYVVKGDYNNESVYEKYVTGISVIEDGGETVITNKDSRPITIRAPHGTTIVTPSESPALLTQTLASGNSIELINTSQDDKTHWVSLTGLVDYVIYNKNPNFVPSFKMDKEVSSGIIMGLDDRIVITSLQEVPITVFVPFDDWTVNISENPALLKREIDVDETVIIKMTGEYICSYTFISGSVDYISYYEDGEVSKSGTSEVNPSLGCIPDGWSSVTNVDENPIYFVAPFEMYSISD